MRYESMAYMIALSNRRCISAAAAECGVAQSSFSGHLQRLEKNLGCTLFDRKAGELTPEGELYVAAAKDILRLQSAMEQELAALNCPALRLGISETTEKDLLSQVTAAFFKAFPKREVRMDWGHMGPMISRLRQGEFDLIFGIDPGLEQSDIIYEEIMTEQLFLMLPKEHPAPGSEPLQTLHELNFVVLFRGSRLEQEIKRLLSDHEIRPVDTLESNSYQVAHLLVRDSFCAAIVPASVCPLFSDCSAVPLRAAHIGSGFCYLRQFCANTDLRDMIRLFKDTIRCVYGSWKYVHVCEWEADQ